MIASLPMYLRDETRAAYGRLWQDIRDRLRVNRLDADVPEDLSEPDDPWHDWTSPDLLLSQTCGLPYRTELHDRVCLVGTPDFALPGCAPGYYNSVIVMRAQDASEDPADWSDLTLAVNEPRSQSGWAAPMAHVQETGHRFGRAVLTGAHRSSARAVAEGRADIAAIDAHTWAMMTRWDGFAVGLREVTRTTPTPGLPYITADTSAVTDLQQAIRQAIASLSPNDVDTLRHRGFAQIPAEQYLSLPPPEPRDAMIWLTD